METKITNYLSVDGKKLYYEAAGEGTPLVFLHSGFLDSGMWNDQWEVFAKQFRVVRYDMRGFGKSDALEGPTVRRAELHALLQHLGIEAAYLVGCSQGGESALDFALEHPEMVLGLVLVSSVPSGFEMQGEPPANLLALIEATQQGDFARMTELQMRLWIDGPFRQPHEVDARVRQAAASMTQTPVRNMTWAVVDMQPANPLQPPAAGQLGNVQKPTLVVVGALDDPEILRAAEVMEREIAGAQRVVIANTAHTPNMEKPAEFNRVVLDFLRAVDA